MQVPVFTFLTSWPLEDLTSPLNAISVQAGELFDRLELSVREDSNPTRRRNITCAHLRSRRKPKRPPPRVLVFTGPAGAAKRAVMAGLVAAHPSLFARVVTHTSRRPKEHEVDGVDYHFTDAPTLRCRSLCRMHADASPARPGCDAAPPTSCMPMRGPAARQCHQARNARRVATVSCGLCRHSAQQGVVRAGRCKQHISC
jgi:hypothetical protein